MAVFRIAQVLSLLLCPLGAEAVAQGGASPARSYAVPVSLVFETETPPGWRLEADQAALRSIGVIREGDQVEFAIPPAARGQTRIGEWFEEWRYFSHERCRRTWYGKKKCERHYATSECRIPYDETPLAPHVKINLRLTRESLAEAAHVVRTVELGSGRSQAEHRAAGPLDLLLSGRFAREAPSCSNPPGGGDRQRVRGPTLRFALGKDQRHPWFPIMITVRSPQLED